MSVLDFLYDIYLHHSCSSALANVSSHLPTPLTDQLSSIMLNSCNASKSSELYLYGSAGVFVLITAIVACMAYYTVWVWQCQRSSRYTNVVISICYRGLYSGQAFSFHQQCCVNQYNVSCSSHDRHYWTRVNSSIDCANDWLHRCFIVKLPFIISVYLSSPCVRI